METNRTVKIYGKYKHIKISIHQKALYSHQCIQELNPKTEKKEILQNNCLLMERISICL